MTLASLACLGWRRAPCTSLRPRKTRFRLAACLWRVDTRWAALRGFSALLALHGFLLVEPLRGARTHGGWGNPRRSPHERRSQSDEWTPKRNRGIPRALHRSCSELYAGKVVSRASSTGPPTVKWYKLCQSRDVMPNTS
jgi:hypothetical protein